MTKIIVCDLDGVLCEEVPTFDKPLAQPIKSEIDKLNNLHFAGYTVILHTARGWAEYKTTKDWLKKNHVTYDELVMGKPIGTFIVDDRSFKTIEELQKHLEPKVS
jgi:hypothetical protein